MTLILAVILVALVFEYINGFHDTANVIATTVSTKVMRPFEAVIFSAIFNLLGALAGTAVASTIGKGLVDTSVVTLTMILCALISGIGWNLLTWWIGLPSSSSHALVGGLCGAALGTAHGEWSVIRWAVENPVTHKLEGLLPKVVIPMAVAPLAGFAIGWDTCLCAPARRLAGTTEGIDRRRKVATLRSHVECPARARRRWQPQ